MRSCWRAENWPTGEIGLVQLSRHRESAHRSWIEFYEAERVEHGPNRSPPPARMAETPEPESRATLARPSHPQQLADSIREAMTELASQLQVSHNCSGHHTGLPAPAPSQGRVEQGAFGDRHPGDDRKPRAPCSRTAGVEAGEKPRRPD